MISIKCAVRFKQNYRILHECRGCFHGSAISVEHSLQIDDNPYGYKTSLRQKFKLLFAFRNTIQLCVL